MGRDAPKLNHQHQKNKTKQEQQVTVTITKASDGQRKPYNHAYLQTYPPYATISTKPKFEPCFNIQFLFLYLLQYMHRGMLHHQ